MNTHLKWNVKSAKKQNFTSICAYLEMLGSRFFFDEFKLELMFQS